MFTGMMAAISGNAALGWIVRRIFDWGGWLLSIIGGALALFSNLDPATQAIIVTVLQRSWQEITLGSLAGLIALVFSQWRSWRATVNPHVVTSEKKKHDLPTLTEAEFRKLNNWDGPIERRDKL